jgi:hypothetical protein
MLKKHNAAAELNGHLMLHRLRLAEGAFLVMPIFSFIHPEDAYCSSGSDLAGCQL